MSKFIVQKFGPHASKISRATSGCLRGYGGDHLGNAPRQLGPGRRRRFAPVVWQDAHAGEQSEGQSDCKAVPGARVRMPLV